MQFKNTLLVFPTSRAIRRFHSSFKSSNKLLPFTLSIDEFLKKAISIKTKKYCEREQRFLFLKEAIKNTNIKKLGILDNFSSFLKQYEYIYRFFLELASEKVDILSIQKYDTYEFYEEHLIILQEIRSNYLYLLDKNNYVDKINLDDNYEINKEFLDKFENIEIFFEGYFTKIEFDIIKDISKYKNLQIEFYSNSYNSKSVEVFNEFLKEELKLNYKYNLDLTKSKIISKDEIKTEIKEFSIEAFSSRINQIAYIKSSVVSLVNKGINPSSIAVVLPDEAFASQIQLFDEEKYFNYAMGKDIKTTILYQTTKAISLYLDDEDIKNEINLSFFNIEKTFIDNKIKVLWNKFCKKEDLDFIIEYLKKVENNKELLKKFDELVYKLNILLFSSQNNLTLREVYKILLQALDKLKLDDINSGKVTVMGVLETRAIDFEAIIVPDFNESFIPKKSIKDKFLSSKIKYLSHLPTSQDRESLQKYYYKRLVDSTKYVYISYVNSQENNISRFASELFSNTDIKKIINDEKYKHILYNTSILKHFDGQIIEYIDLSNFTWSATSLKSFLDCKRKFYLQYILRIKEHTISLKPKAFELGSIVHKVLEDFYRQDDLSYESLEKIFNEQKTKNAFLRLDLEIWKKRLFEFHKFDMQRLKDRKILEIEKSFNIDFEGIKISGFIDRIDLYNKNTYEVIDYKTSSSLKVDSSRNYDKSSDFQLEFYYLATQDFYKSDNIKVFYYDLSNLKLLEEVTLDKKLELLRNKFKQINELSKDKISFDKCENKVICTFCPFKVICKRD